MNLALIVACIAIVEGLVLTIWLHKRVEDLEIRVRLTAMGQTRILEHRLFILESRLANVATALSKECS